MTKPPEATCDSSRSKQTHQECERKWIIIIFCNLSTADICPLTDSGLTRAAQPTSTVYIKTLLRQTGDASWYLDHFLEHFHPPAPPFTPSLELYIRREQWRNHSKLQQFAPSFPHSPLSTHSGVTASTPAPSVDHTEVFNHRLLKRSGHCCQ